MNFLFDLSGTQYKASFDYSGGSEYIITILTVYLKSVIPDVSVFFLLYKDRFNDSRVEELIDGRGEKLYYTQVCEIEELVESKKIDVFFSGLPYHYGQLNLSSKVRLIYTIHGLREIECFKDAYESYYFENQKQRLRQVYNLITKKSRKKEFNRIDSLLSKIKENDLLITVSEHTKYAIVTMFNIPPERIKVLYSPEKMIFSQELKKPLIKEKYFLIINGNRWIKNVARSIIAFDDLVLRKPELMGKTKLVITGNIPPRIKKLIKNHNSFIILDFVKPEELQDLYKNAIALFFSSLNEGFGYPPIEAMKWGTPVLASAVTAIPEICGAGAIYFNPYNITEMQERLLMFLNPELRMIYSEKAKQRYAQVHNKQENDLQALLNELLRT